MAGIQSAAIAAGLSRKANIHFSPVLIVSVLDSGLRRNDGKGLEALPQIVLTGPPGSGKSSLLHALESEGLAVVAEPARRVIAEQRRSGGRGTSEQDPALFISLMLEMANSDFDSHALAARLTVFDRGLPDLLAYAAFFRIEDGPIRAACKARRYTGPVFFAPAWEGIFTQDEERTLSFDAAAEFGAEIRQAWEELDYGLVDLPLAPVESRTAFVLDRLSCLED